MEVFCCHVLPCLHLAWYSLPLDWTIFPLEPALLQVMLMTQKRQSPKWMYMYQRKNLQCLQCPTNQVYYTNLLQGKSRSYKLIHMFFDGIGCFPRPQYHIQVDLSVTSKQTPCWAVPVHLEEPFKQEIDKMLQSGILKPVHQATSWINSFVLVEGKDKPSNLKLKICLDPTNLNKSYSVWAIAH